MNTRFDRSNLTIHSAFSQALVKQKRYKKILLSHHHIHEEFLGWYHKCPVDNLISRDVYHTIIKDYLRNPDVCNKLQVKRIDDGKTHTTCCVCRYYNQDALYIHGCDGCKLYCSREIGKHELQDYKTNFDRIADMFKN